LFFLVLLVLIVLLVFLALALAAVVAVVVVVLLSTPVYHIKSLTSVPFNAWVCLKIVYP
jgi:hypothetical protein